MEHIGSTSVPGLAAKPVIDLMASTPHLGRVVQVENDALKPLGYTRMETGMSGRLCYRLRVCAGNLRPVAGVSVGGGGEHHPPFGHVVDDCSCFHQTK